MDIYTILYIICIIGSILCIKDNYDIVKYTKKNKSSIGPKYTDFIRISWLNIIIYVTLTIKYITELF